MSELKDEAPNGKDFKSWLIMYLTKSYQEPEKVDLLRLLGGSDFTLKKSGKWGKRSGYRDAKLYIKTNPDFIDEIIGDYDLMQEIIKISNIVITATDYGIEVSGLEVIQRFTNSVPSLEQNIEQILASNPKRPTEFQLPEDLIQKAKEMSEAYTYIYFIENALRVFIENVRVNHSINISGKVQKTIDKHKEQEAANRFLPLRGDSDLFYCDFIQLGDIIRANWDVFKQFFPNNNEHWLKVKIDDLYRIRCLVAHCGYIGEEERHLVKTYFNIILKQLK